MYPYEPMGDSSIMGKVVKKKNNFHVKKWKGKYEDVGLWHICQQYPIATMGDYWDNEIEMDHHWICCPYCGDEIPENLKKNTRE